MRYFDLKRNHSVKLGWMHMRIHKEFSLKIPRSDHCSRSYVPKWKLLLFSDQAKSSRVPWSARRISIKC